MKKDLEVEEIIDKENIRQRDSAIFIASENYASEAVRSYTGSILTNKYAEGYPGKRYYAGCENVDIAENLAINRGKELFECDHMNVQPHSGSQANMAVYMSLLKTGDRILSLSLDHGGHLSHGHNVNFSGKLFDIQNYYLNQDTEIIDYEQLEAVARKVQPKIIICGYSAYSRTIDFQKFKQIAKETNSLLMADIAHIAGLVASKLHPSPVGIADIITSTTHKTLRGPRGGIAIISKELSRKYDRGIFPMIQGGPIMNTILAKAVAFKEALSNDFKNYSTNIISNSKLLAKVFQEGGLRIVSGGTDNHLMLLDLRNIKINGSDAEEKLNSVGIIVNKNAIPFDPLPPNITSGIRVGTPAITTRRINEEDLSTIGDLIVQTLKTPTKKLSVIKSKVTRIMQDLPLP